MTVELSNNEMWKILDALEAYKKNYAITGAVEKTINGTIKKLKGIIHEKH